MSQLERNKTIETSLDLRYEMSQTEVGKELGIRQQEVHRIEKLALENFKLALQERGIDIEDLF
jgi:DNA-directed RNA polymerase specialized sigma subunit